MEFKAILFDLYGTLIDIETDEHMDEVYRGIAHFLTYLGIDRRTHEVKDQYWGIIEEQKKATTEKYLEINVEASWQTFLTREGKKRTPQNKQLAILLAQLFRALSRKRLKLYPDVIEVLESLAPRYALSLVSDAQPCFALPEMRAMGLSHYFQPTIISEEYGFRKPDQRLFDKALSMLKIDASQAIFVGNDMYRDIYGAKRAGLKTVFFASNQGAQTHNDTKPDYVAYRFTEVLDGISFLEQDQ